MTSNTQATYALGYGPSILQIFRGRSAQVHAAHLIPHLKPGMRVLDAGSGQGSISLGLARIVGPGGDVTGFDFEPSQVEDARIAAREAGVSNIRFQQADVTKLPFPDATFDAVFMYALMCHVTDRKTGIRELFRVMKPGAVIATSDPVFSRSNCIPDDPVGIERTRLSGKTMDSYGGDGDFGLRSAQAFHDAGFVRLSISTGEGGRQMSAEQLNLMADRLLDEQVTRIALQKGLVTHERLAQIQEALRAASRKPFHYLDIPQVNVVGWKP